ncbi:MAG TPA: glycosyltransferase, partial [Blastocatellia bacterium]|nr:glycosyltransferase [Blastocatellia bacterium]
MKILFLIRALNLGGAQSQMVLLAKQLHARGHEVHVLAFYDGPHQQALRVAGVSVHTLNKRGRWDVVGFLWRLTRLTRQLAPDILYGYLAACNLLVSVLQWLVPSAKAVWGIRIADLKLEYYGWLARTLLFLERKCSQLPALIITNSQAGREHAIAQGFPAGKTIAIPNGIDSEAFYPDPVAREKTRAAWNVTSDELLIGIVGRIDPIKEHAIFLTAAHKLRQRHKNARFVCVGEAVNPGYQNRLFALTQDLGLQERVIWAG